VRSLKDRAGRVASGQYIVEGPAIVAEALALGAVREIWCTEEALVHMPRGVEPDVITTSAVMKQVSDTTTPQGVLAICNVPSIQPDEIWSANAPIVVADRISDPGNLGTILRTAAALGLAGVITTAGSADLYGPKVVRSSAGAIVRIPAVGAVPADEIIKAARSASRAIIVLDGDAPQQVFDALAEGSAPANAVWVVGSEAHGAAGEFLEAADLLTALPMPGGTESLNAAVSLSVALYAAWNIHPWDIPRAAQQHHANP
jgi:TrmH family RNA methyltransferase